MAELESMKYISVKLVEEATEVPGFGSDYSDLGFVAGGGNGSAVDFGMAQEQKTIAKKTDGRSHPSFKIFFIHS